jgi:putative glutamine amidotransferase
MLALGVAYLDAVASAGGIPVILAPTPARQLRSLVERLDGICLSGGPDVEPSCYGAEPHPELGPTEPQVDLFEIALIRAARRRGLPILGICRGMQVLNVARGGTLIQHVPGHRQTEPGSVQTHGVTIAPGSKLAGIAGNEHLEVNSFHHQGIERLGRGLNPVAWSDDGLIEALEAPAEAFTLGVQWHAECLTAFAAQARLFTGLVDAAAGVTARARAEAA